MTVPTLRFAGGDGGDDGGWQLADNLRVIRSGMTDGAGAGVVTFDPVDGGRRWEITRAVITCGGADPDLDPPTLRFYVVPAGQEPAPQYELSGSAAGFFDEADYPGDGLWVLAGEQLLAVWAGAPANQPITTNLQLRLMVKS